MDLQRSHDILQQHKGYLLLDSDVTEKVHAALNPAVHCTQGLRQVTKEGRKVLSEWTASWSVCLSAVNPAMASFPDFL